MGCSDEGSKNKECDLKDASLTKLAKNERASYYHGKNSFADKVQLQQTSFTSF
jgi:hypothetical protein